MGMSTNQTLIVGGLFVTGMVTITLLPAALVFVVPVLLVVGVLIAGRWHGEPLWDVITRHLTWRVAQRRGWNTYRAGVGVPADAAWQLPGALAPTALLSASTDLGVEFGVVWNRRSGTLTAVLRVAPSSTWLVDAAQADQWVGNWHGWLAKLGYARTVKSVAVTVETAPAPASALAAAVRGRMDPNAPAAARAVLDDLLAAAPTAAAQITTRVAITIDPALAVVTLDTVEEQCAEMSRLLSGLEVSLGACGVAVMGRATTDQIAGWVRVAFDPAARSTIAGGASGLTWADARPVAAQEAWDSYTHDSGVSVSWAWDEAPRQAVTADVLARIMGPGPHAKRVTMVYRPVAAAQAARELEGEAQATLFKAQMRRKQGRDESARDLADRERAQQAAREEARGAGLVDMQMFATATVTDPAQLSAAVAEVEHRAEESRIRLRRLYGGQPVGFAVGLSCGIDPHALRSGR